MALRKRVLLKSPVRKIRTPGSVRGLLGNWQSYRNGCSFENKGANEIKYIVAFLHFNSFGLLCASVYSHSNRNGCSHFDIYRSSNGNCNFNT